MEEGGVMENEGWIKLHRKLLNSNVFKNEKLLKIWIWCLCKVTHKELDILVEKQLVHLYPRTVYFWKKKSK